MCVESVTVGSPSGKNVKAILLDVHDLDMPVETSSQFAEQFGKIQADLLLVARDGLNVNKFPRKRNMFIKSAQSGIEKEGREVRRSSGRTACLLDSAPSEFRMTVGRI